MSVLGFNFTKHYVFYAELSGSSNKPQFIGCNRLPVMQTSNLGELQSWYATNFTNIIEQRNISAICMQASTNNLKSDSLRFRCYPQGVLCDLAFRSNISVIDNYVYSKTSSKHFPSMKTLAGSAVSNLHHIFGSVAAGWKNEEKLAVLLAMKVL